MSKRIIKSITSTIIVLVFAMLSAGAANLLHPRSVSAISGADFSAGHIIDDAVFTDSSALTADDVQTFLSAKMPNCDVNGTQATSHSNGSGGYYTRAQWGAINGHPAPFTCLKDFVENPSTTQSNYGTTGTAVSGGISAAQIIWNSAQAYHINPAVLLTTLQKEQGLVTDDWPWLNQYQHAMGYACPDTGGCSPTYAGFYKQVDGAAYQYRYYLDHPGAFNYSTGANNIQFNPDSSCGSSVVNIQNAATSALYIYTPYQPNQAALNSLTGVGDSCSAYGNRNFWYYFNAWFGSPYAAYTWNVVNQNAYTDSSRQTQVDLGKLGPGQRYYLTVSLKNTGNVTWQNGGSNPVNIGASGPRDRSSAFCDSTWLGCNRPGHLHEYSVTPGQVGSFGFWITTPAATGSYNELFTPLVEGIAWMGGNTISFPMIVNAADYSYVNVSQQFYTDATKSTLADFNHFITGQRYYAVNNVRNKGNVVWNQQDTHSVRLGAANPQNRKSAFCDSTWIDSAGACTRPAALHEYTVAPEQTGSFEYWLTAPAIGDYSESFTPLAEGLSWMKGSFLGATFHVSPAYYSYSIVQQYAYIDSSQQTPVDLGKLVAGKRYYIGAIVKNTGNTIWQQLGNQHTVLGAATPQDRTSPFCDSSWLACNRVTSIHEYYVAPGQIGSFSFWITAPSTPGNYNEVYAPLIEGVTWMDSHTIGFPMIVH